MNKTILAVLAGVLAGGGAIAAYQTFSVPYAEVVSSTPITQTVPVYGDVIGSTPITEMVTGSRQVCQDVTVEKRRPERFGNKDGAVIGAVVGGLVGSQVGGGDGKKLATVAGAVGGGFAGREIDRRHVGGERYTEVEQQCHTETAPKEQVIGYDVQYRADGEVKTTRVDKKPGAQIKLGDREEVIGYDVTWRYQEQTGQARMDQDPGDRLPVVNGAVVVADSGDTPPNG